ncbi:hypothetical protein [Streptomyces roseoviridis]|uniref:Lipoprotein n=1 Tax=Streptomyces roseoviridis TaxID=67361 RepID=A0ABV5QNG0_9ACTN
MSRAADRAAGPAGGPGASRPAAGRAASRRGAPAGRRSLRRAAAALLCLLPLAACGIQGSDVVEAGGPAPVTVHPTGEPRMLLFFADRDGRLMPVARDIGFHSGIGPDTEVTDGRIEPTHPDTEVGYRAPVDTVLSTLLEGPEENERAAGLTTRLAPHGAYEAHALTVPRADGTTLQVRVRTRVKDLDPVALRQLVCTAAYAQDPTGAIPVAVRGIDGEVAAARCLMN